MLGTDPYSILVCRIGPDNGFHIVKLLVVIVSIVG